MVAYLESIAQRVFKKHGIGIKGWIVPRMDLGSLNIAPSISSYYLRHRIYEGACWRIECYSRLAGQCAGVLKILKKSVRTFPYRRVYPYRVTRGVVGSMSKISMSRL